MRDRTRVAIEVGDDATGLTDEENAGGDVPWREGHLPEGLEAAAGDVGEVERGGAGAANACRVKHDTREQLQISVRVRIARLEGKSRSDESPRRIGDVRDRN